jgi:mannose-1-phosphate guanylyltransferase
MISTTLRPLHCGIVLAGGDGRRLQPLIRQMLGYDLPKQYVSLVGTRSMLEHTYGRAERLIPPERIFTVVGQEHMGHYEVRRQLSARPERTIAMQPRNRETGPGILLPLVHLFKHYPSSIVAVFPSDHFILEEDLFAAYVAQAFAIVEECPAKIVFLGVEATDPEPEYGYLLPEDHEGGDAFAAKDIKAFIEKPDPHVAAGILKRGALWNTMVMVFKPEILLHLISLSAPNLYHSFQKIFRAIGSRDEAKTIRKVYDEMDALNFSKDLLEGIDVHSRNQLSAISMKGVFWSDWGSRSRIISVLDRLRSRDFIPDRMSDVDRNYLSPIAGTPLEAVL